MTFMMIWDYFFTTSVGMGIETGTYIGLGDMFNEPLKGLWESVKSVPMGW